ncbi:class I SAM-dependent methyltransferase [Polynucleobacter sp. CS-Odin-A6]|uniref:class I SAM-dependent methyltransferase n=1 Tax=Polynucleobacter sp. CS-Odin-A6 TaxID=2689106 RepID=UPI001C0DE1EF|nr:class I SAM-dependent methyltransferase [Polynucleobacter sp. CS-Odin-A6]MBU3621962.1 class I SAM-dependent methyltransferase [Polynucleobacter sp. CS-Odin-A6]
MKRIDYGIDAPNLFRGFITGSLISFSLLVMSRALFEPNLITSIVDIPLAVMALYLGFMGCLMYCYSKFVKLIDAQRLLGVRNWTGNEQVLDIGCGRGLFLINAAQRLFTGKAIGIDIWSATDQSDNSQAQTLDNLALAKVTAKCEVQTADMRNLPFTNNHFDVITSGWVIHNLEKLEDRKEVIREIVRTLKPGGMILVSDIVNQTEYVVLFKEFGLINITLHRNPIREAFLKAVSFGSFGPFGISATKPLKKIAQQVGY